jgi:phosphoribosylamine---glycine ligase
MKMVKHLIVGGGGRETKYAFKLLEDDNVEVHVWGGLTGMLPFLNEDQRSRLIIHEGKATDLKAIVALCKQMLFDLVVVGPEVPLIRGLADALKSICPVFGFNRKGAKLEGSKIHAKRRYEELGFPTAMGTMVRNVKDGLAVLKRFKNRGIYAVLKCITEAGGKGVRIVPIINPEVAGWDHWEAQARELTMMMDKGKPLGFYAQSVLIEVRYPEMNEWSAMSIVGPNKFWLGLPPTLDHKLFNGYNSGGMGTVTPAPGFSMADMETRKVIVQKLQEYLADKFGTELCGILYEGLNRMGLVDYLVEINCRGGDPETQVQLDYILGVAFHKVLLAAYEGDTSVLGQIEIPENLVEVGVVMASRGYPGPYAAVQGKEIWIPGSEDLPKDGWIIPSGLIWENGIFRIKGSRVAMAIGRSYNPDREKAQAEATKIAYQIVGLIKKRDTEDLLDYRKDIGGRPAIVA